MRALVFANGDAPSPGLLAAVNRAGDLLIAADGGARHIVAAGLEPDAVVGDLDSVDAALRGVVPADRFHLVSRLDTTDLEKAVAFAIARGCDEVEILGASGGRSDHALANLSVLTLHGRRARLRIHDEWFEISAVDGEAAIQAPVGTVVSLLALGECTGVTTEGLRWPLHDFTLPFGPRGVHNEVSASPARVRVATGDLLLFKGRWVEKHA